MIQRCRPGYRGIFQPNRANNMKWVSSHGTISVIRSEQEGNEIHNMVRVKVGKNNQIDISVIYPRLAHPSQ